jgi:hypothetical protein|nr:MAG TPA: Diphosphoinositol pentakisphosphate kinase 2 N-terminal domain [Caudoviricetes sp.]
MKEILGILLVIVCLGSLMYLSFLMGRNSAQKEIINRAKNSNNIEVIIFGEKQL